MASTVEIGTNESNSPTAPNNVPARRGTRAPSTSPSYQCGHCRRGFSRLDHLSRHVRTHTLEKPYSCIVCKKTFARADLLKRHGCRHSSDPIQKSNLDKGDMDSATRVSQACTVCAVSKLKCSEQKPCQRCVRKNLVCEYGGNSATQNSRRQQWRQTPQQPERDGIQRQNSDPEGRDDQPNDGQHQQQRRRQEQQQPPTAESQIQPQQSQEQRHRQSSVQLPSGHGSNPVQVNALFLNPTNSSFAQDTSSTMNLDTPSSHMVLDGAVRDESVNAFSSSVPDLQLAEGEAQTMVRTNNYTEFLKDLLFYPPQDLTMDVPSRAENQTTYNIWDTFMTTSLDWDYDMTNLAPDTFRDVPQLNSTAGAEAGYDTMQDASPQERAALAAGVQAFKTSFWHWVPSPEDFGAAEQSHLSLSPPVADNTQHIFHLDPTQFEKRCQPADRDRVLALLMAHCEKDNIVRIISSFPSIKFMENVIHLFLRSHASQTLGFLHIPTFEAQAACDVLLTALIAYGACLTPVAAVQRLGYALPDIMRRAIIERWDRDNSQTRNLQLLQSYVILITLWLWSGNKRKMEIGESFEQPAVTILRRSGMLRRDHYTTITPEEGDEGLPLEHKWRLWVEQESKKRLVHHLFAYDAQASMTHLTNPLMSCSEMTVPLPEANELWFSKSASAWKSRYLSQQPQIPHSPVSLADCVRGTLNQSLRLDGTDVLSSELLTLYGLWGFVWQCRQDQDMLKVDESSHDFGGLLLSSRTENMARTLQAFQKEPASVGDVDYSRRRPESVLVQSFLCMTLYVPLQGLQSFAGKHGEDEAQRIYPMLQEWTLSREARLGMWYAGQVIHAAKQLAPPLLRDFYAVAVYQASLALYGYGIITAARRRKDGQHVALPLSPAEDLPSDAVWLGGNLLSDIRKFISLGEGRPAISGTADNSPDAMPSYAFLQNAGAVMDVTIEILRRQAKDYDGVLPPFVENITQLMGEIGRVAQALGLG